MNFLNFNKDFENISAKNGVYQDNNIYIIVYVQCVNCRMQQISYLRR